MSSEKFNPALPDDSKSYQIYATVGVAGFAVIATTLVRIIVKLTHRLPLVWDDYLIVLGTV
jgi:hypothetical protein